MKFFITGGAGFIGRHLIESLLENNHDVTIYEDFSNSNEDNIKNICEQGVLVIHGDLSDYSLLEKSLKDFDFVIHLAAKIDILESITNPEITNKVNVQGTINILEHVLKITFKILLPHHQQQYMEIQKLFQLLKILFPILYLLMVLINYLWNFTFVHLLICII